MLSGEGALPPPQPPGFFTHTPKPEIKPNLIVPEVLVSINEVTIAQLDARKIHKELPSNFLIWSDQFKSQITIDRLNLNIMAIRGILVIFGWVWTRTKGKCKKQLFASHQPSFVPSSPICFTTIVTCSTVIMFVQRRHRLLHRHQRLPKPLPILFNIPKVALKQERACTFGVVPVYLRRQEEKKEAAGLI
ncbi:hypothetical protein LXL04_012536 [Taraxacum kok-saghyz]